MSFKKSYDFVRIIALSVVAMKTYKNLYKHVCDWDNLLLAAHQAMRHKRSQRKVAAFRVEQERELLRLYEELRAETYCPGNYRTFHIYEPKKRLISAAPFRDRVVHHALCNVIQPLFERSFIYDSYANRKGKGTHAAIRRAHAYVKQYPYALKCDIQKYFPSINRDILKQLIRRTIACPQTLRLIDTILDNSNPQEPVLHYFPNDDLFSPMMQPQGLPMGNLTSQFFANVYLNPLDHYLKDTLGVSAYVRYVDDFVLFSHSKTQLHQYKQAIVAFLHRLRLCIHPRKSVVLATRGGLSFLGQKIYPTHRLLLGANVQRFYRRLRKRIRAFRQQRISVTQLECSLNAWRGHAQHAHTHRLQQSVFTFVNDCGLTAVNSPSGVAWWLLEQQY